MPRSHLSYETEKYMTCHAVHAPEEEEGKSKREEENETRPRDERDG
jgi:hypothetical protein